MIIECLQSYIWLLDGKMQGFTEGKQYKDINDNQGYEMVKYGCAKKIDEINKNMLAKPENKMKQFNILPRTTCMGNRRRERLDIEVR
jgi:hypothetical protein